MWRNAPAKRRTGAGVPRPRELVYWNAEILMPLVEADEELAPLLAEGALLRLRAGARCYDRYRRELGV